MKPAVLGWCLFLFIWGLTTHGKNSAAGDEPHYLAITRSLAQDRDLDVTNNYDPPDLPGGLVPDLHARMARDGRLQSVHDIGLPALLVPSYLLAAGVSSMVPDSWLQRFRMTRGLFEYAVISLTLLALFCWSVVWLARGLLAAAGGRAPLYVVALIAFSPPVLSHAPLLFPEEIAFIVSCAVVWWVLAADPPRWSTWTLATALGLLPWCHRKFSLFVLACAVTMVAVHRERLRHWNRSALAALGVLFVVPHAAFHMWTIATWGSLGGPQLLDGTPFTPTAMPWGFAGLLWDRQAGLVANAPIYLVVFACWCFARGRTWWLLLPAASLVLPMSAYDTWWAGFSPPARYLVPVIPFCAAAMADSAANATIRRVLIALAIVQIPIILYGWQHPRMLWPREEGNTLLFRLGVIGRAYERFLPEVRFAGGRSAVVPAAVILIVNAAIVLWARRYDVSRVRSRDA